MVDSTSAKRVALSRYIRKLLAYWSTSLPKKVKSAWGKFVAPSKRPRHHARGTFNKRLWYCTEVPLIKDLGVAPKAPSKRPQHRASGTFNKKDLSVVLEAPSKKILALHPRHPSKHPMVWRPQRLLKVRDSALKHPPKGNSNQEGTL
ncbi:uncharacterized protein LOC125371160 [Ricinus communis]|uniref:uncharacterized protein LOC125371160 n=1 Tax=Ricinus communis TaxID=3988 RepID=UPI00201A83F6|nr:uncharacterized protein LOC125371160 [Ricinus communis]